MTIENLRQCLRDFRFLGSVTIPENETIAINQEDVQVIIKGDNESLCALLAMLKCGIWVAKNYSANDIEGILAS